MSLNNPISKMLYGIQLGILDSIVFICLLLLTSEITDADGRMFARGIAFIFFLCAQVFGAAVQSDKGNDPWVAVLEVGYVTLGVMVGAMGVHRAYVEYGRRVAVPKGKK